MESFSEFYITESNQSLKVDWVKGVDKGTEITEGLYDYAKSYFSNSLVKKNGFTVNDKTFFINDVESGDPQSSEIKDKGMLKHSWTSIKEIIKYTLNYGIVYLITVSNESGKEFYYIGNDKAFTKNSKSSIYRVLEYLKPKQQNLIQKKQAKRMKPKEVVIPTPPPLTPEELEKKKSEEEIKKLGASDPRNGRYGYYDIDFDEYRDLIKTLSKDVNTLSDKSGYAWTTNSVTSEGNKFGEGKFFKIKGADKKGEPSLVYLFYYYDTYIPNTGMLIFDGGKAFNDFYENQIIDKAFGDSIEGNGRVGRDKKVPLKSYKQVRWVNEDPRDIAPPETAETVEVISKVKKEPTNKKIGWYDKARSELR